MSEKTAEKPAPTTMNVVMAEKTHRPIEVIEAELDAAMAEWKRLEPINTAYTVRRAAAVRRFEAVKAQHKSNPTMVGVEFDPAAYPHLDLTIPPEDCQVARDFHRQHYVVGRLRDELEKAKVALTGDR